MATLQYQCSISLDGFIAGRGGDMQWMHLAPDVPTSISQRMGEGTAVVLAGARTYRGDDPNVGTEQEGAYGGTYEGSMVVLTHHPDDPAPAGVEFAGDLRVAVARASELAGDGVVGVLGADVARQCLDAALLDEVAIIVLPVLLGDGIRVLDRPGGDPVRLETIAQDGLGIVARVMR